MERRNPSLDAGSTWRPLWYRKDFPLHSLGPNVTGATPGLHKYTSQVWTEGTGVISDPQEKVGIEDAHDEEETDKER